jgi:hypothetical protein
MSEQDYGESGEERIDETGRNPTQQRMDEEGVEDAPVAGEVAEGGNVPAADDPDAPWAT